MKNIYKLAPIFKHTIWGGDRLRRQYGYNETGTDIGECWGISAHKNGDCTISNGQYKGYTLSRLWSEHREVFGNAPSDIFPLLVKIIDAKEDLSIQVHPNDEYAKTHENGSCGKTECWYILDCEKDSTIIIGHNAKSKEELIKLIDEKRYSDLIREIPIEKGDFFQINPGCIHAIKGGTLILETQENSDITYRVYDYDRERDGKKRELNVEKCKEVIEVPYKEQQCVRRIVQNSDFCEEELISNSLYTVYHVKESGKYVIDSIPYFCNVTIIDGEGYIDNIYVNRGDNIVIGATKEKTQFDGIMEMIISHV